MTRQQKSATTRLHRWIYGAEQGEAKHPALYGDHYDVVAFKRDPGGRRLAKAKRDIGQRTPKAVKVIFVKQLKMPGESDIYSTGAEIVHRRGLPDILINGWTVRLVEPINALAYVADPQAEERRALAVLWDAFDVIKAHMARPPRNWELEPGDVQFLPLCDQHDYISTTATEEGLQELLEDWRARYNQRQSVRDHVQGWLKGIVMVIRVGQYGRQQFAQTRRDADAKRKLRAKWLRQKGRHHPQYGARPKTS
jgi:hypothetical protein